MSQLEEIPDGMDMRIESEPTECGLRNLTITAKTEQAEIDLAMEYPRIVKLLTRDWLKGEDEETE